MPKRRYEQREPTQDWQQIRPLLKDTAQITYEVIRPVILWGQTPKERAVETGVSYRTIYYKANLFDQAGMASLLPPTPPPEVPRQDKRSLPPDIRQEIVDLHGVTIISGVKHTLRRQREGTGEKSGSGTPVSVCFSSK
jgi:hypothetical protein